MRIPLFLVTLAITVSACDTDLKADNPRTAKPNVVLVIADDLTYNFIGCYGNEFVKTPHIDALSRQGMRFTSAYTSTAMCAPSRAQLYTGLFPIRNGAYPNHSRVRQRVQSLPHYLQTLGYRVGLNGKKHFKPARAFPFEAVGKRKFDPDAIRDFVGRDSTQPFCLVVASSSPHVPWSSGDHTQYESASIDLPNTFVDTPETRAALSRYLAEVSDLDRETGICMEVLRENQCEQNTIFIFTSEQGAQFPGAKWTCYEEGLRVGLVIRWLEQVKPNSTSDAIVHFVDVVPTLIDAAGGSSVDDLDGRSFLPVLKGEKTVHRNSTYGVHTQKGAIGSPETGYPIRSIRVGQYKYIMNLNNSVPFSNALTTRDKEGYWASWLAKAETDAAAASLVARYINRPPEELYDLSADPWELKNLITDPAQGETIKTLRSQLQAWMAEQGDRGMQTELEFAKRQ